MDTSTLGVTSIIGTRVPVITSDYPSIALALEALVIGGAQAVIITKRFIGKESASPLGIASIVCARVVIKTFGVGLTHASPPNTLIFRRTIIPVIAKGSIRHIQDKTLPRLVIAPTGYRTRIPIIGARVVRSCTHTVLTDVHHGAGISIVTGLSVGDGLKHTTHLRVTHIGRTSFPIIALNIGGPHAQTIVSTGVPLGAGIPIITRVTRH